MNGREIVGSVDVSTVGSSDDAHLRFAAHTCIHAHRETPGTCTPLVTYVCNPCCLCVATVTLGRRILLCNWPSGRERICGTDVEAGELIVCGSCII